MFSEGIVGKQIYESFTLQSYDSTNVFFCIGIEHTIRLDTDTTKAVSLTAS